MSSRRRSPQYSKRSSQAHSSNPSNRPAKGSSSPQPSSSARYELTRPVFFVGFMGAGKTSVSRRLARMCHVASVDLDAFIERREQKKIKEVFASDGEEHFRALETQALREFSQGSPLLVSCGGGIVLAEENRTMLKESGFVVYLKVAVDEAAGRISDITTRPLFLDIEKARERNIERSPLYEDVADVTIDTASRRVVDIALEIRNVLIKEKVLCQLPE